MEDQPIIDRKRISEEAMDSHRQLLKKSDSIIFDALIGEEKRQQAGIELIPSENYTYPEVLATLGSVFTNKYSEGYPGRRYYGGQQYTDVIEDVARERAKQLFRSEHANVQPLSGSPMNQAVYMAFLQPGDTVLGMDLSHGGHLTHGAPVSHMGKIYNFIRYKTLPEEKGRIDFDELRRTAIKTRPKLVLCGYSSYPRDYDYSKFKEIADTVGALTMADVSHIGGLIAGGVMRNPCDADFDFVTTTTHKSMRGPRGGMILCKKEFAKSIDRSVFPGLQGGPHMNAVAAVAITLGRAQKTEYKEYCRQVLKNAQVLSKTLMGKGTKLITDGTENHMMVIDTVKSFGIDGQVAEGALDEVFITTNKQIIPDDPNPPLRPSGIRLGTPAATTRGMKEQEMKDLGQWITKALANHKDKGLLESVRSKVEELCMQFPVPGIT